MELVPIIYKVLAICVVIFLVVLAVSFLFMSKSKNEKSDYKKIIEQRKIEYSEQYRRLNTSYPNQYVKSNFHKKVTGEVRPVYDNRKLDELNESRFSTNAYQNSNIPKLQSNKPRYTILNETMSIEPIGTKGNKEVQIFYPINFQRSA